ncbi:MAG: bifunctional nicotinamide-nucleotide adenylyltransferase/Nudix hydroxylase [Meiothermus sp.]|jgi:bifunctional NMN adenylyltransferase/nudix hydrolase|uniref:bifunctional nicotinamide-nucleotide adenylyltransferase/Nudix hydroxylase n=1 Tax=Meiothermus sp. TaxID=1955249 RepID=UPI0028CD6FC9|nr:bifunctional nicotinamide-nucleotide adenylyltransferase/Nudix hydroxylase [Meiothermus sp.]MDT7920954.1 bifunctional nicotinamide-nucleotide adenylyltransferase/Nudix hydroxylase [Meiothermus sp.]
MKTAVFIGRFQPPHQAHLETITRALSRFDRLIVVLGSAFCHPTPKNPFSAEERAAMIRESLSESSRLHFIPIADDYYNDPRWFGSVRAAVEALTGPGAEICITGYHKDESSYYLHGFGDWPFEPSGVVSPLNATDVRNSYFASSGEWKAMVPLAVRQFMEQFARTPSYSRLQREWKTIQHYRSLERRYPYPILHIATDAVVLAQEQVLLVERKGPLGQGAWALPGGYVELKETLLQAALRELREETGLALEARHLKATQAFDYPGRSLRGRVISLGHFFDLGDTPPPAVEGQDDASRAFWLPLAELDPHQDRFFEDHYQQICWFLGRAPHQPALSQTKEPL